MKSITCPLRSIVAFLSEANLKEYLRKAVAVLPSDNALKPIIIKEVLDSTIQKGTLKATLQKLKAIVKAYDASNRKPFQVIILEPIQAFLKGILPFDPTEFNNVIREQKETLKKTEKELLESKKVIKDVSTIPFPKVLANK